MQETAQTFKSAEEEALEKAQRLQRKDAALTIPSVGNVPAHCKTFAQKADHCAGALLHIVSLFYLDWKKQNGESFHELVKTHYGNDDVFCKVTTLTTPFLTMIRDARDCLEHRNVKGVKTTDFELQPDGTLAPPTIEIDFRQSSHERCPISRFMQETTKALLNAFEMIIIHTCSKHVRESFLKASAGLRAMTCISTARPSAAFKIRWI